MADKSDVQLASAYELAYSAARQRGVVGDDGEVTLASTHEFVNETLGGTNRHEPPINRLAPSGIIAAASLSAIVFMVALSTRFEAF